MQNLSSQTVTSFGIHSASIANTSTNTIPKGLNSLAPAELNQQPIVTDPRNGHSLGLSITNNSGKWLVRGSGANVLHSSLVQHQGLFQRGIPLDDIGSTSPLSSITIQTNDGLYSLADYLEKQVLAEVQDQKNELIADCDRVFVPFIKSQELSNDKYIQALRELETALDKLDLFYIAGTLNCRQVPLKGDDPDIPLGYYNYQIPGAISTLRQEVTAEILYAQKESSSPGNSSEITFPKELVDKVLLLNELIAHS